MKRQNVRTLALIVVTFTYLLVGAAIFDALESSYEEKQKIEMDRLQDDYVQKFNMSRSDFEEIYKLALKQKPIKAGTQWKFAGSFYFATTVITTIGYGHSTPKTIGGKIFCMIYALPGIPLTIVMFQSIGERMNMCLTLLLQWIKRFIMPNNSSGRVSQTKLILLSSNFVTIVVGIGALIFSHYENWNLLDSVYYCLITLTTIGFGDLVALQKNDFIAKRPDYVAFSLIFILFGLTVVSSMMNLLVLRFLTMNTADERRDEIVAAIDHDLQQQQLERYADDSPTQQNHSTFKPPPSSQNRIHLNNIMSSASSNYYRFPSASIPNQRFDHTSPSTKFHNDSLSNHSNTNRFFECGNCLCCLDMISNRLTDNQEPVNNSGVGGGGPSGGGGGSGTWSWKHIFHSNTTQPRGHTSKFHHPWQQWNPKRPCLFSATHNKKSQHYTVARGPAQHVRHLIGDTAGYLAKTAPVSMACSGQNRYHCSMKYKTKQLPLIRVQQVSLNEDINAATAITQYNYLDDESFHESSSVMHCNNVASSSGVGGGGYYYYGAGGEMLSSSSQSDWDSVVFMSLASPGNRRRRCASL